MPARRATERTGRPGRLVGVDLTAAPCRSLCDWSADPGPGAPLACAGCGSQWRPGQGWTPRQADGTIAPSVLARLSAGRAASAGSAGS